MKKIVPFLLALFGAGSAMAQQPAFITDSLDAYIARGLKDWDLPGISVVVVKDGQVVLAKGYGVRDVQTGQPVDAHTLFMIASNTKLFTGTALALLEARGKINLNDPVRKYFSDYRLYEPTTTQLVSIRDLLSHRIGTKTFQGDFTFWNTLLTRSEIMKRMRLLKPSQQFRQDYGYCNSCFLTAGQVIPRVTGYTWEDFVRDSIVRPLEMNETRVLSTDIEKQPNVASPYTSSFTGVLQRVPYDNWNNLAPAASIVSSVSDLSHWLLFQLDSGKWKGKQVLPWSVLQKTRDANIVVGSRRSSAFPTHFRTYGLGLFATDYNGRQLYWHTGGAGGMVSNVCFVPEERLGIAILTNNDNQNFFEALRYQILDAYLNVPYVNRSQQFLPGFRRELAAQVQEIDAWKARVKGNKPALALNEYAGTYQNPLYGNIRIRTSGDSLIIRFLNHEDLEASLHYMDNGEWLMTYNNIEYGIFAIRFEELKGKVRSVTTRQNEYAEQDPYVFIKTK
ncbi:MAG: serine hydrolase [Chitinophagaceae bacterium]|nr:MAG: serine hydrolase [Chitinophagaceae bacterium]